MKASRTLIATAIVGCVATAYLGATQAGGYSNRSLRGTYGLSGSGTIGFGTIPAAVVGLNSFDRAGHCDISASLNAGGLVTPLTTAQCTYSVRPDGTGTLDVRFNEAPFTVPFHSDLVIVDGGNELLFVLSDGAHSTVASGVAKRQSQTE
jgi:hypothetical protein